jgi:cyclophilin family peptidyl-prolyl cis-trans isomerase/HEAT repeat protein
MILNRSLGGARAPEIKYGDAPRVVIAALLILGIGACTPPDGGRPNRVATTYLKISAAEDSRPSEGRALETLLAAARLDHVFLKQTAVRSLGRLQNPDLVEEIAHHLSDPATEVRAESADAIAQAVHGADGTQVLELLRGRLAVESDPGVRGIIARSLGRLDVDATARSAVLQTLLDLTSVGTRDAPIEQLVGVSLGIESLVRAGVPLGERAQGRLASLLFFDLIERDHEPQSGQVRTLVLSALGQSGSLTVQHIEPALRDPSSRVRVVAASHLSAAAPEARAELIRRGLGDPVVGVRLGVVRQILRDGRNEVGCSRLIAAATQDMTRAVRILAFDGLGESCGDPEVQRQTLMEAASALGPETVDDWQVPAHALVALATFDADLARPLVPVYVAHSNPFVRAYGARAADLLGEVETLRALTADPDANVRTVVLQLLAPHGVPLHEVLISQLASDDPQLLMTTARMLTGSDYGVVAATATLSAFERISRSRRETSRDARRALLTRVAELGDRSLVSRLEPFLTDFDEVIAGDVARTLRRWTGQAYIPRPQPLSHIALPTVAELRDMEQTTVTLHMRRGGQIVIRPLPYLALTNAYRFVRLAKEGYFDGLTFHRWVPNFVIQGGSPGANEYFGDGPFTRDEVGLLPHWRGTVGVSTRGHDTGDAQIFVNLIDNVRLDHDYTVYGIVADGIEVVDDVVEGDVIERVEVRVGN